MLLLPLNQQSILSLESQAKILPQINTSLPQSPLQIVLMFVNETISPNVNFGKSPIDTTIKHNDDEANSHGRDKDDDDEGDKLGDDNKEEEENG